MAYGILERVQSVLEQQRNDLIELQENMPAEKKVLLLGTAPENGLALHVEVIEESIERAEAGSLGKCKVCHDYIEPELLEVDYTAEVCLSHLSKNQINQLENELELAKTVQRALLPKEIPNIPGLDVAAYSRPAQFVGGDYFDFVNFRSGIPGLVIADIAGHGVSASLQMASIQALTRAILPTSISPAEAASHIHNLFIHNINFTTFVTLFYGEFDPATKILTYSNAGQNPPLVIHASDHPGNHIEWLRPTAPAIGLIEDALYEEGEVALHSGDLLLLYTDGVIEAMAPDNSMYGDARLVDVAERFFDQQPREIIRGLRESIEQFVQNQPVDDDITFVAIKIL